MFSLICTRINGWVNNREAGDKRCLSAHYDVIVMHKQLKMHGHNVCHIIKYWCLCAKHQTIIIHRANKIDGLVQDCSNPSALAMDLLHSCTKHSKYLYSIWSGTYKNITFTASSIRNWNWIFKNLSSCLTHWGRSTHICVSNQTIIGSDNGLSPGRRQAIIWTKGGILLIEPSVTNFSEI